MQGGERGTSEPPGSEKRTIDNRITGNDKHVDSKRRRTKNKTKFERLR